jgi:hypothetical protein
MNPFQLSTPILTVTNPVLLWFFRKGGEDPEWGLTPVGQIAIASIIYEMANQLSEPELRRQIQAGAANAMARTAERMAAEQ